MRNFAIAIAIFLSNADCHAISFITGGAGKEGGTMTEKTPSRTGTKRDSVSTKMHSQKKAIDFDAELAKRKEAYDSLMAQKMDAYYTGPIVLENSRKIKTLDTFNGMLRDSSILTQTPEEIVIHSEESNGILFESKLRCKGGVVLQRVKIYCDLLVTPEKEYSVKVLVREKTDGASTLLPDKLYTGEEARFVKQSFASFFGGVTDASKDRTLTLNGEKDLVTVKNKVYDGLFAISDNATNEIKKDATEVQIAAVINSGREVKIEFLEGL